MLCHSISPPFPLSEIIADGKLHRCSTVTKHHKKNGAYITHLDSPATLWWCNWENSEQGTFTEEGGHTLSPAESESLLQRHAAMRQQRDAEFVQRQAAAAQSAQDELNTSAPCPPEHPYLQHKGIPAFPGMCQDRAGALLIPVKDASGKLQSLQRIFSDGEKCFLTGGKVHGGYFAIQEKTETFLAVCEGYATGASIHLACDCTYMWLFGTDLPEIAAAAQAGQARFVLPAFHAVGEKDFNDLHQSEGLRKSAASWRLQNPLTPLVTAFLRWCLSTWVCHRFSGSWSGAGQ